MPAPAAFGNIHFLHQQFSGRSRLQGSPNREEECVCELLAALNLQLRTVGEISPNHKSECGKTMLPSSPPFPMAGRGVY